MRYFQDKTQTEVAGVMGISQVQVSRLEKKNLTENERTAGLLSFPEKQKKKKKEQFLIFFTESVAQHMG